MIGAFVSAHPGQPLALEIMPVHACHPQTDACSCGVKMYDPGSFLRASQLPTRAIFLSISLSLSLSRFFHGRITGAHHVVPCEIWTMNAAMQGSALVT